MLAYIFWDPPRVAFTIPIIHHPVYWYSLLFAAGFLAGYFIMARLLYSYLLSESFEPASTVKKTTYSFLDRLAWYVFIGMIVGARLGHVFFYEWPYFRDHPIEILYTWEGGLSSHGGGVGLLLGLFLFWKNPRNRLAAVSFKRLLDYMCIATSFVAGAIRLGNFFNQEILGTPSNLPFAVWFGHPADPTAIMPCHPVQAYESLFYFAMCWFLYKINPRLNPGKTAGLFFVLIFTFRFFIEFFKLSQGAYDTPFLSMGQMLSIPFIIFGIYLLKNHDKKCANG